MDYKSIWTEICLELSEGIKKNVSEEEFEKYTETALRELGWKKSSGDFETRFSIRVGANKRMIPDFVIRDSSNNPVFVIEIKKPRVEMRTSQLQSYMRQLKLDFGIFIGSDIKIYYDGNLSNNYNIELIKTIIIDEYNVEGIEFVKIFNKQDFRFDNLQQYVKKIIELRKLEKQKDDIINEIKSISFLDELKELALTELTKKYSSELVKNALSEVSFKVIDDILKEDTVVLEKNRIEKRIEVKDQKIDTNYIKDDSINTFDINSPGVLKFTKINKGSSINGKEVKDWQVAARIAVILLIGKGINLDEIISISKLNIKHGIIKTKGFHLIKDYNLSMQNKDINHIGQSLSALAKKYNLDINITYRKTK